MHNFMLSLFKFVRSFWHFMKIVVMFCILMLLLYWIENLTNGNWDWLNFIKPFLGSLVKIGNTISSGSWNLLGAVFEFKYGIALIILITFYYLMNLFIIIINIIEDIYDFSWRSYKKAEEDILNKNLYAQVEREEKKISKYNILIHTSLKKQYSYKGKVNIAEQNKLMNKYLIEKTGVQPAYYMEGYLYKFKNFNDIDTVLDILFNIINSNSPLDYAITIQTGDNLEKLTKLANLKIFNKIIIAADTAYRYEFNTYNRYKTAQIGIFQDKDNGTLEVHEFQEFL